VARRRDPSNTGRQFAFRPEPWTSVPYGEITIARGTLTAQGASLPVEILQLDHGVTQLLSRAIYDAIETRE